MKLEDQVISIPQAMRLNELGISQYSLFYHTQDRTPTNPNLHLYGYLQVNMPFRIAYGQQSKLSTANVYFEFSAFTVAELGEMLPPGYDTMYNTGMGWCGYDRDGEHFLKAFKTEAECRAAMLIELIQRKEITAGECNELL